MNTELKKLSDEILLSEIQHTAHAVEKLMITSTADEQPALEARGESLQNELDEWAGRGLKEDQPIQWARDVLAEFKGDGKPKSGSDQQDSLGDAMELIRTRRSVRAWSDKDVPPALIEDLLEAARWAPSSCNRQAVRLVVLRDEKCKTAAVGLNEKFLLRAPVLILVGVDLRIYGNKELCGGAPYLDAAAAIQNMLLVGHSLGLGCLWAKASQEDWIEKPETYFATKQALNLPNSFRPVTIIAVGWAKKTPRTPPRNDVSEFVRFDDAGFPQDDFEEWRPNYMRLRWFKLKSRISKTIKTVLGKR